MDNKLKLAGYCRVSTDLQSDNGTIEIQEHALNEFALANGHELVKIFKDEGVSGGLANRPGLAELFSFLEANEEIDACIIFKLDRLARDLYLQEHLIKKLEQLDKKLISTKEKDLDSDDPMRKAFRQFMGIVSELEKAFITLRLSAGRINKAHKGFHAGGAIALGYKANDKDLVIDADKAGFIQGIFKLRFEFNFSYRQIAHKLNELKVPTSRGGKWYAGTVKYIVENPLYKGELNYSTKKVIRDDLAIITSNLKEEIA